MASRVVSVFLLSLLVGSCWSMSAGPPTTACFTMTPQHGSNVAQSSASPVTFSWNRTLSPNTVISPGQHITVTLQFEAGRVFKGFMVQARTGEGPAINSSTAASSGQRLVGRFLEGEGHKTLHCSSPDDTATHKDSEDKHNIEVIWVAPDPVPDEFSFFYTVVESFDTFWVMLESPGKLLGRTQPLPGNELFIKLHGSLMSLAWGVLIPLGIILALFYKVVWPNGHWFYFHIVVMVLGVLVVIGGIVLILLHAEWKWLDTTELNMSHQVLGIIALTAVVINPLLGLFLIFECCSLGKSWRKVYNVCHGSIGLVFAQGIALCAMLAGVHILRDHPRNFDQTAVHSSIYSVSAIAATVILIIALYNGYHVRYHKDHAIPDVYEEDPQHSKDWWFRLLMGCGVILLLITPVGSTIYFLFHI